VHQAKAPADEQRAAEQRLDLLGPGVGGDVEILGLDAEQHVAHRAAHHVARMAALGEHVADLERGRADRLRVMPCLPCGTRCGPGVPGRARGG
jgi:hypothetical protein